MSILTDFYETLHLHNPAWPGLDQLPNQKDGRPGWDTPASADDPDDEEKTSTEPVDYARWDEGQHPRKGDGKFSGKQVSAETETNPETPSELAAQTDPDTIAAEIQQKTGNVLTKLGQAGKWLKAQTRAIYDRLEARYGRKTAIAIFAAGHVVGLATPLVILPGSTLIGMAPFAALAETYLQAKRGLKALTDRPTNYERDTELSPQEINELAADIIREILTGWEKYQKENPEQYSRFDQTSPADLHALIERLRKVGPVHKWTGAYRELAEILQRFPDLRRELPAQDVAFLQLSFGE